MTTENDQPAPVSGLRILVVDNYDSFVFNLVQYLAQLGAEPVVRRNDAVEPAEADDFDGVLLSPGPGTPEDAGVCVAMVTHVAGRVPLLGGDVHDLEGLGTVADHLFGPRGVR